VEHEISSIQVLHHKKQVALHRGMEGGRGEKGGMEGGKEDPIEEMERRRDGGRGRKGERKGKMVQEGGGSEGRRKVGRKKELK